MAEMMPQGQEMEGQEQGQVGMIIETVGQGLTALNEGLAQSNAPDEAKQLIAQALESFMRVVEIMGGGGGSAPQCQPMQDQNQQVL